MFVCASCVCLKLNLDHLQQQQGSYLLSHLSSPWVNFEGKRQQRSERHFCTKSQMYFIRLTRRPEEGQLECEVYTWAWRSVLSSMSSKAAWQTFPPQELRLQNHLGDVLKLEHSRVGFPSLLTLSLKGRSQGPRRKKLDQRKTHPTEASPRKRSGGCGLSPPSLSSQGKELFPTGSALKAFQGQPVKTKDKEFRISL